MRTFFPPEIGSFNVSNTASRVSYKIVKHLFNYWNQKPIYKDPVCGYAWSLSRLYYKGLKASKYSGFYWLRCLHDCTIATLFQNTNTMIHIG